MGTLSEFANDDGERNDAKSRCFQVLRRYEQHPEIAGYEELLARTGRITSRMGVRLRPSLTLGRASRLLSTSKLRFNLPAEISSPLVQGTSVGSNAEKSQVGVTLLPWTPGPGRPQPRRREQWVLRYL